MSCEICGSPLRDKGKKVVILGAVLSVCEKCSKHGYEICPQNRNRTLKTKTKKDLFNKLPKDFGKNIEDYEVVNDYAEKIRSAREKIGWTVDILAGQLNEKVSVIKKIESGKMIPSIDLAKRLEKILNIKLLEPSIKTFERSLSYVEKINVTLGDIAEVKNRKQKEK
ncbi:MAG: multiprotein bridging factor aMBF1 [Candidatus Methanomethylicia archaeon]|nr:multiprotein bridging factor aMBF1 [Candidatus Methanomethylicia archaeon]MCX8169090.1 multiprotein bridging factor aMBF1 [Candidatus Methanomethylicia archaeon]MDW7988822.1 multiprotein bridging factor aMBF1 [Nitrososphaerota archaeon]